MIDYVKFTDLHAGKNKFINSNIVESVISYDICSKYYSMPNIVKLTCGNFPGYDFEIGNDKYELKIKNSYKIFLETHTYKGQWIDSGISLSKADYYLILSLSGKEGDEIFKLRKFTRYDIDQLILRDLTEIKVDNIKYRGRFFNPVIDKVDNELIKTYKPYKENNEIIGFYLF